MLSELWRRDATKILLGCVLLAAATWIWNWGWIPWLIALVVAGLALGMLVFGEVRHTSVPRWLSMLALVALLVVGLGVAAVRWPTWLPHPGEPSEYDYGGQVVSLDRDHVVAQGWVHPGGGTSARVLVSRDHGDGSVRWRVRYDEVLGQAAGSIVVIRGRDLVAVDARTGTRSWRVRTTGSEFDEMRVLAENRVLFVDRGSRERLMLVDADSGDVVWRGPGAVVDRAPHTGAAHFVQVSGNARTYTVRSADTGEVRRTLRAPGPPGAVTDAVVARGHLVLAVAAQQGGAPDRWVGLPLRRGAGRWSIASPGPLTFDGIVLEPEVRQVDLASGEVRDVSLTYGWRVIDRLVDGFYVVRSGDERGVWQPGADPVAVTDGAPTCDPLVEGRTLALTTVTDDAIGDEVTVLDVIRNGDVHPLQLGADGYPCPALADGFLLYGTADQSYVVEVDELF